MSYAVQSTVIQAAIAARKSTVLWGDPGLAKSALVGSIAGQMGLPFEVVDLTGKEPGDLSGLPFVADNSIIDGHDQAMVMAPPDWALRLCQAGTGVLLLDEIGSVNSPAVAAAVMAIVNDRRVGSITLPDDVVIMLAGNRPDSAVNGFEMPAPLANRVLHIDFVGLTAEDWGLGLVAGFDSVTPEIDLNPTVNDDAKRRAAEKVAGFIQHRPNLLHAFPTTFDAQSGPWPSRRSWEAVAKVLPYLPDNRFAANGDKDLEAVIGAVTGLVGHAAAIEFAQWLNHGDLVDPREVMADPSKLDWSDRPDRVFAVLLGIVAIVKTEPKAATWNAAWQVLGAAETANRLDTAGAAAAALLKAQPPRTKIPAEASMFLEMFTGTAAPIAA